MSAPIFAQDEAAALRTARSHLERKQYREALDLLLTVTKKPTATNLHLLGIAYQGLKDRDRAIGALAQSLKLKEDNADARRDLRELLKGGFPLNADTPTLDTIQRVLCEDSWQRKEFVIPPLAPAPATRACFTSGLLFPPAVPMRDPVRAKEALATLPNGYRFNRVSYVYVLEPNEKAWRQRFRFYYVSDSLIDKDFTPLVAQLAQACAQVYVVGRDHFGLRTRYADDEIVTLWVTDAGPQRAEQHAIAPGHIFLYSSSTPRSPGEWLREVAHEYSHLALPPIDGFLKAEESHVTGLMGEALLLTKLAEADSVLGFPVSPEELRLLADRRRQSALDAFRREGPRSPLTEDLTDVGASYAVTFLLHVLGTHGAAAVKEVLGAFPVNANLNVAPPVIRTSDLFTAYEKWARTTERMTLAESAAIAEGESISRWVYAPSSRFTLSITTSSESNAAATLAFYNGTTRLTQEGFVIPAGEKKEVTVNVTLSRPGWILMQMSVNASSKPVRVQGMAVRRMNAAS